LILSVAVLNWFKNVYSLPIPHQFQESPEIIAPGGHDKEATQITWPDTANEAKISPQATTPPAERRSQRPRKTSYADILAQSKYDS
jgi:hypothetical protein